MHSNRVLLATAYLVMLIYVAWPLVDYPRVTGLVPNIAGIALIACTLVAILRKMPAMVAIVVAALNAAAGIAAFTWLCWAIYTMPAGAADRNIIPAVLYFATVVPLVGAFTLFSSARKNGPQHDLRT